MMKPLRTAVALGLAGIALGGCGARDEGMLSQAQAQELLASLNVIEQLARERKCLDAAAASEALIARTGGLGSEVDEGLRRALVNGAERLVTLARDPVACTGGLGEEQPTEETPAEETGGKQAPDEKGKDKDKDEEDKKDEGQDEESTLDGDGGVPPQDQPPDQTPDEQPPIVVPPQGSGGTTPDGGSP